MMLPISAAKIAGCLIAFVPVVWWFVIGALLAPKSFTYEFDRIFVEGWFWWMVFSYVLLLHLITFWSLFFKWGAIPLGIGIMFFSNMICISRMQSFIIRMGGIGGFGWRRKVRSDLFSGIVRHADAALRHWCVFAVDRRPVVSQNL